jgi:hypothetical protein
MEGQATRTRNAPRSMLVLEHRPATSQSKLSSPSQDSGGNQPALGLGRRHELHKPLPLPRNYPVKIIHFLNELLVFQADLFGKPIALGVPHFVQSISGNRTLFSGICSVI